MKRNAALNSERANASILRISLYSSSNPSIQLSPAASEGRSCAISAALALSSTLSEIPIASVMEAELVASLSPAFARCSFSLAMRFANDRRTWRREQGASSLITWMSLSNGLTDTVKSSVMTFLAVVVCFEEAS